MNSLLTLALDTLAGAMPVLAKAAGGDAAPAHPAPADLAWEFPPVILWTVDIGIVILALGGLMCVYRLVKGPHLADRSLAVDTLGIVLIGIIGLFTIKFATVWFIDGILVLSLLGFAGTVALAQYIARPYMKRSSDAAPEMPPVMEEQQDS